MRSGLTAVANGCRRPNSPHYIYGRPALDHTRQLENSYNLATGLPAKKLVWLQGAGHEHTRHPSGGKVLNSKTLGRQNRMRFLILFIAFTILSLLVMIIVDFRIGEKAEFLNAWSVIERLLGKTPSAGGSLVFNKVGGVGELTTVFAINALIGAALAFLTQFGIDKFGGPSHRRRHVK